MRFLIDANLSPRLADLLRASGYECDAVRSFIAPESKDREVTRVANELAANVITRDVDFVDLRRRGVLLGAVVWLRFGNMSTRLTAQRLLSRMPAIVTAIEVGEIIVEVR